MKLTKCYAALDFLVLPGAYDEYYFLHQNSKHESWETCLIGSWNIGRDLGGGHFSQRVTYRTCLFVRFSPYILTLSSPANPPRFNMWHAPWPCLSSLVASSNQCHTNRPYILGQGNYESRAVNGSELFFYFVLLLFIFYSFIFLDHMRCLTT
jgi:hypothetical protein